MGPPVCRAVPGASCGLAAATPWGSFLCVEETPFESSHTGACTIATKGHVFKVLVWLNHSCLGYCSPSSCLLRLFPDSPNPQQGLEPLLPWLLILCLGTRVSSRALACMSLHAYTRVVAHTASFLWGPRAWSLLPHLSSPTLIFRVCLLPNPV